MLGFESAMAAGDRVEDPRRNDPAGDPDRHRDHRPHLSALMLGGDPAAAGRERRAARTRLSPSSSARSSIPRSARWSPCSPRSPRWARSTASSCSRPSCRSALARNGCFPAWFARFENRFEIAATASTSLSSGLATLLVLANYTRRPRRPVPVHGAGDDLGRRSSSTSPARWRAEAGQRGQNRHVAPASSSIALAGLALFALGLLRRRDRGGPVEPGDDRGRRSRSIS